MPFFDTINESYRKGVVFYIMKKRILSAVLVSGVTLSAAASVHAEDYDSQIVAADNAISNLASQQETAQAQVATIQSQVSTLRTQKSELETKNAELEKVSADLESEIQELSSKIVARQDSLAKQARSAQQNNTATSYINSILNSKSISEAITRITAISKVVTANNDMLTKQESDQKELAAKQEENQAAINEIATNKAELETTEAGLTTQQAELEAAQVALAAELATAQDEKTSLVSAKSTAEAVAASTAASVAQSQAIAESEAAAQAVASSEAAAFVAQSEAAATSEATVSETATSSEAAQEPVSSATSETTQAPTAPATSEAQLESAAPVASEAPAPASEAPVATSEAPASQAPAASEAPAPAAETPKVSAASTPNTYPVGQCTWGAKSLASWVGNYWGNAKNWIASAQAAGHSVGTTPVAGAIAVWPNDGGGYGHVAYVTSASGANSIQVMESNYAGNMSIGNYRGTFDPTSSAHGGSVYYIYP
ncbi:CHAP domain protein [Streptococcus vestibularis ATCC 49124]|nr:CHAP domain protein [Streptococcus vestibularis ATCC 49124]